MKVKMLTTAAGPDGVLQAGRLCDVNDEQGRALVQGNYAVEVKDELPAAKPAAEPVKETAALEPAAETTAQTEPKPKPKRRPKRRASRK